VVTQVFQLRNESANNLLPVLRPLISPNNTIAAYPANNTLVVTDYADNVRVSRRSSRRGYGGGPAGPGRAAEKRERDRRRTAAHEDARSGLDRSTDTTLKVSVTADPRTNSLLLRASNAGRLNAATSLAKQLDGPTGQPGNMHVVPVRNADATKLAKTLRGMLGKGGDTGSSAGSNEANSSNQSGGGSFGSSSTVQGYATAASADSEAVRWRRRWARWGRGGGGGGAYARAAVPVPAACSAATRKRATTISRAA